MLGHAFRDVNGTGLLDSQEPAFMSVKTLTGLMSRKTAIKVGLELRVIGQATIREDISIPIAKHLIEDSHLAVGHIEIT